MLVKLKHDLLANKLNHLATACIHMIDSAVPHPDPRDDTSQVGADRVDSVIQQQSGLIAHD